MLYANFINIRRNRIFTFILHFIAGALFLAGIAGLAFMAAVFLRGERSLILLLIPSGLFCCFLLLSCYLSWFLQKAEFTEDGIVIKRGLKQKVYNWDSIEEYGVFAISMAANHTIRPYFLFMLSSPDYYKGICFSIDKCFMLTNTVIPVRYSNSRNQQLEKILGQKTKVYDWISRKGGYVCDPDRLDGSYPVAPWPTQEIDERGGFFDLDDE